MLDLIAIVKRVLQLLPSLHELRQLVEAFHGTTYHMLLLLLGIYLSFILGKYTTQFNMLNLI